MVINTNINFVSLFIDETNLPDYTPSVKRQKLDNDMKNYIRLMMSSGKVFKCEAKFLNENSNVFSSMLSTEYSDFKQPHISIMNIDENAFEQMLHFVCGCSIRLDEYPSCLNPETCKVKVICPTTIENSSSFICNNAKEDMNPETNLEDFKTDINSTINAYKQDLLQIQPLCNVPVRMLNTEYASALLVCSDRFFVDDLKNQCERYLMCNIHNKNVVDLMLLAIRHRSNKLLKQSLAYLLSSCECPLLRSQNFAELLYSTEKSVFIENIKFLLTNAILGKENKVVKKINL